MVLNICTKFGKHWSKDIEVRVQTSNLSSNFSTSKGYKSWVTKAIWLVIKLSRDIMLLNICIKFGEYWSKDVEVRLRKSNLSSYWFFKNLVRKILLRPCVLCVMALHPCTLFSNTISGWCIVLKELTKFLMLIMLIMVIIRN